MARFQRICIKVLIFSSRVFLRTCGVGLLFVYFGLFGCITYSFFKDILPEYVKDSSSITVLIATILFSSFAAGSVFNYLCATFSSPGYTKDYQHCLLRGEGGLLPHCNTCNLPKPHNAHHCSFCNKCILNLDHHCPWINNCVGFNNMRFFLLFLLYSFLACFIYFSFAFPIIFKDDFSLNTIEITYFLAVVLSCTLTIALFFFNIWSWYLAITDQQFIDVLKSRNRETEEEEETKQIVWKKEVLQRRLFEVFGTRSFVRAFLPSTRKLKVNPISCEVEDAELLSYGQA